jgi:hypothetical protein
LYNIKIMYIDTKISKFLKITGIINNIFKPNKVRKNTKIKLYSTLVLPVLLYGSDGWTIKAKDEARLISAEMKFMRRTVAYIWSDFKQNTEILDKTDWRDDVNRMSRSRTRRWIMSRNVICVLIYHRHKPLDHTDQGYQN